MNLHRSAAQPDWVGISPVDRGAWQRLAARTGGLITPGNLITVLGFALVLAGLATVLRHAYWWGLALIAAGRLGDILDGLAAEATDTKSPLGEALDVACDKAGSLLAFGALVIAHVISWQVAALLLLSSISIVVLTALAAHRRVKLHPSRPGKLSMAATWGALICFLLAAALKTTGRSWLRLAGDIFTAAAFILGSLASSTYAREIFR